ncbi:hypothetical protein [Flavobacterium ammonificans]|uniref:Lipoprotein n=1 Tax=Flavobacterium ammonificans TaxID=1751056 RepID=A0ABN6KVG0_9FLAO|nr:hypothetical protein [Flavobacterium ammonificans]BDB53085.1 hypothetical protein GENT11_13970 [Flavobacterium ammonificans]
MKNVPKIILGFLLVFTFGCTQNKKPKLVKPTPKPIVWHIAGLPNWFYLSNSRIIYNRWGINIFLDGCSGSIEGVKNNKKVAKILKKRHGKYWQQVFQMSVEEEILNRYSVIDLVYKSQEVVAIQKKFHVSKENSTTRVMYIDKNRYAILVTWYVPSDDNISIPGQQLIVNLATKQVAKSDRKFNWRRAY